MDLRRLMKNLFKNLLGSAIDLRFWIRCIVKNKDLR